MKHSFIWIRGVHHILILLSAASQIVIEVTCSEYKTIDVDNPRLAHKENFAISSKRNDNAARSYYLDYVDKGFTSRAGSTDHNRFRTRPYVDSSKVQEQSLSAYHTNTPSNYAQTRSSHDAPDSRRSYVTVDTDRIDKEHTVTINMPRMSRKIKKFVIQPVIQYVVQYDKKSKGGPEADRVTRASASSHYEQYYRNNRRHQRLRRGNEHKVDRLFNDVNANFESYWDNHEDNGRPNEEDYSAKGNSDEEYRGGTSSDYDSGSTEGSGDYMTTNQMHQPPSVHAYIPFGGYGENSTSPGHTYLIDNSSNGINSANMVQIKNEPEMIHNQFQHNNPTQMQHPQSAAMVNSAMNTGNFRGVTVTNTASPIGGNTNGNPSGFGGNFLQDFGKDITSSFSRGVVHFPPNGVMSNSKTPISTSVIGSIGIPTPNLQGVGPYSHQGHSSQISMGPVNLSYGVPGQVPTGQHISTQQFIPGNGNGGIPIPPTLSHMGQSVSSQHPAVVRGGLAMSFGYNQANMANGSPGNFIMANHAGGHAPNIIGSNIIADGVLPTVFTSVAQMQTQSSLPGGIVKFATIEPNFHNSKIQIQGDGNMAQPQLVNSDAVSIQNNGSSRPAAVPELVDDPKGSENENDTSLEDIKDKPLEGNHGKKAGGRSKSKGRRGRGGKWLLPSVRFPRLPPNIGGHLSFMFSTGFGKGRRWGPSGRGDGAKVNETSADGMSLHKMIDAEQVSNHILNILGLTVHHHHNSSTVPNFSNNSITNNPILVWEEQGNRTSLINLTSYFQGVTREFVAHHPVPKATSGKLTPVQMLDNHNDVYANTTLTSTTVPSITAQVENDTETNTSIVITTPPLSTQASLTISSTVANSVKIEVSTPPTTVNFESRNQNPNETLIAEQTAYSHPSIITPPPGFIYTSSLSTPDPRPSHDHLDHFNSSLPTKHYPFSKDNANRSKIEAYYAEDGYSGNPIKILEFDPWIHEALQAAFQPDHQYDSNDE